MSAPHQLPTHLQRAEFAGSFGDVQCLERTITYQSGTVSLGFIPVNGRVLQVFTRTTTTWTGDMAVDVGDAADPDRLMDNLQINPTAGQVSLGTPFHQYTSRTEIFVTVSQTTATAGVADVLVTYTP